MTDHEAGALTVVALFAVAVVAFAVLIGLGLGWW